MRQSANLRRSKIVGRFKMLVTQRSFAEFMIRTYELNNLIKLCDDMINAGSTYLEEYRHYLLKQLLAQQLKEFNRS